MRTRHAELVSASHDIGAILNSSLRKSRRRLKQSSLLNGLPRPHFVRPRNDISKNVPMSNGKVTYIRPLSLTLSLGEGTNAAFTLAEVLITLGIIGIVAALTIPALIDNYQKREVPIRLKKMYNTLWNAIELAEIENGPSANWTFSNADESKEFYMTQIRARMKCVNYKNFHKTVTYHPDAACFFSDGSAILFSVFTKYGLLTVHFYPFYSEKAKRYNNSASTSRRYYFLYSIVLTPYSFHTFNHQYFGKTKVEVTQVNVPVNGLTRDQLLNGPVFGNEINGFCNGTGTGCFHVIKRDGWKIAPDYPW